MAWLVALALVKHFICVQPDAEPEPPMRVCARVIGQPPCDFNDEVVADADGVRL